MWTPPLPRWTHFPAGLPTLPDGPMDKTSPSGLGCGLSFRKLASPSSARLTPEQGKAPQTNGTERATLRRGEKAPLLVCVSLLALLDFAAVRPGCGSFFSMRRWHGVLSMEQGERRILEPPPPHPRAPEPSRQGTFLPAHELRHISAGLTSKYQASEG